MITTPIRCEGTYSAQWFTGTITEATEVEPDYYRVRIAVDVPVRYADYPPRTEIVTVLRVQTPGFGVRGGTEVRWRQ